MEKRAMRNEKKGRKRQEDTGATLSNTSSERVKGQREETERSENGRERNEERGGSN